MSVHFRTAGPASEDPRLDILEKKTDQIFQKMTAIFARQMWITAHLELDRVTLEDLIAIARDHDTGALYERLETYQKQLRELSHP